jgi:hypothetical protein
MLSVMFCWIATALCGVVGTIQATESVDAVGVFGSGSARALPVGEQECLIWNS